MRLHSPANDAYWVKKPEFNPDCLIAE